MSKPDAVAGAAPAGTAPTSRLRATSRPAARTSIERTSPRPVPTMARNLLRARYTPTTNSPRTIQGSTPATVLSVL